LWFWERLWERSWFWERLKERLWFWDWLQLFRELLLMLCGNYRCICFRDERLHGELSRGECVSVRLSERFR
jgi:hypothetical protein